MKLLLLSDVHLASTTPVARLDNVVETGFQKLKYIFDYAVKNKISHIIQAGDLVDVKRDWQLLSMLTHFLDEYKTKGVTLSITLGQHDSFFHDVSNIKTIVGVLASAHLVCILNSTRCLIAGKQMIDHHSYGELANVYGASYGDPVPEITIDSNCNILVIHKQILMNKIWSKQEDYSYAPDFLAEHKDFDLILCGDAHQKFVFTHKGRTILNTGVMLRLEASEAMINHEPSFAVYDTQTKKIQWEVIPYESSKLVLTTDHLIAKKETERNFDAFVAQVKETSGTKSMSFSRNLILHMKRNEVNDDVKKIVSEYLSGV